MNEKLCLPVQDVVARYLKGDSLNQIAAAHQVTHPTIRRLLEQTGVEIRSVESQYLKLPDAELVKRYLAGESLAAIASDLGCSVGPIVRRLKQQGVSRRAAVPPRKYTLNEDFFEKIETEAQAYWLGFVLADGGITCNKGWTLSVVLKADDREHVQTFASALETDAPVPIYRPRNSCPRAVLMVHSTKICADLNRLGVTLRKSGVHETPQIAPELLQHLYRGYFDGDGGISCETRTGTWAYAVTSSLSFIQTHQQWLRDQLGLGLVKLDAEGLVYTLRYRGNRQVERICQLLYRDAAIWLPRKMQLFRQLLAQNGSSERVVSTII